MSDTLSHINGIIVVHFKSYLSQVSQLLKYDVFFQSHVVEKIFQNLRVRLKFSIH